MRIAFLVPDNREIDRIYTPAEPYFGTAPAGLLDGFAKLAAEEPELEIHVVSCTQQPMASPSKLADNIWFYSLHVPKIGWLRTGYQGCVRAIRRQLREIKPDLVHAQGTERDCALAGVFGPHPRLLTIHGNLRLIKKVVRPKPWSALALQSFIEGFAVPRFDGVVCITNYTRRAVEHEVPVTWVVPNAADLRFFAPAENGETAGPFFPPLILAVANVEARKNQNAFIQALDPLAGKLGFKVKFFGRNCGGPYGAEFERLIATRPWCVFGGMIGREALRKEFANAALVALPTHEDNCPMAVLEGQAAGVPVMASNVGGVPDLIENNVTGLLTDPNRPETMRDAVERILTNPGLSARLIENGRKQALEKFHPLAVARKHLEIYREMLKE